MNRWIPLGSEDDRYILLLANPANIYRHDLEGNQRSRIDNQLKKFIIEETPESALEDEEKFKTPLRQLKDRGGQVRALGTWCNGGDFDLLVVQVLFHKDDEDDVYPYEHSFSSRGKDHQKRFENMSSPEIEDKVSEWRDRDDTLVFDKSDFDID